MKNNQMINRFSQTFTSFIHKFVCLLLVVSLFSEVFLQDGGRKGTPDREASVISEVLPRRSDQGDSGLSVLPEWHRDKSKTCENLESTPHGTEVRMPVAKDAECYNMGHPNRGTCLVFNQQIFEEAASNRDGSNVDVSRIDATFSRLGFDVVVHDNLKWAQIANEIETLSKLDNHTDDDCVCVFVLTHGTKNDYLSDKDGIHYSSDKIYKPFTADKCPTLAGKPKLFFFQACRGNDSDEGLRGKAPSKDHGCDQTDIPTTPEFYIIPISSDFLIAHSSAEGFESWRAPEKGSWFVQTLCDVLDEFAETTDLLKMLTTTARRVAINFQSNNPENPQNHQKKQMPSTTSTLTRDLYFMPK